MKKYVSSPISGALDSSNTHTGRIIFPLQELRKPVSHPFGEYFLGNLRVCGKTGSVCWAHLSQKDEKPYYTDFEYLFEV